MRPTRFLTTFAAFATLAAFAACSPAATSSPAASRGGPAVGSDPNGGGSAGSGTEAGAAVGSGLPLVLVADVDLPGKSNRFDYQDIDPAKGRLVIAHMNDAAVVVVDLKDGSLAKLLPNIPTARGVVAADDVGRIFVTSSPNQLVIIDNTTLAEISRVVTGRAPDGVAWDPVHKVVGVSDQQDGAISLIPSSGNGTRVQVKLGTVTGNVVFDAARAQFWITVERASPPDQLVAIDPVAGTIATRIDLPGCPLLMGCACIPTAGARSSPARATRCSRASTSATRTRSSPPRPATARTCSASIPASAGSTSPRRAAISPYSTSRSPAWSRSITSTRATTLTRSRWTRLPTASSFR
jgi:hypothetical protein